MHDNIKMSKYNYVVYDEDDNMVIYNFLTGFSSLTKIKKNSVEKFKQLFLGNSVINSASYEAFSETINTLLNLGILVDSDMDENVLYEAGIYDEVYDSKLTLTIFPTGKCNFKCPYCFETSQYFHRQPMALEAQNAMIKFVQKRIVNHRAMHVSWFGGEPLLSSEIIKHLSENFIKICNARHLPYSADVVTNGYLLDSDMFDMLYKLKVYDYMVTVDGFRELHDKQRLTLDGKGSYDVIMRNLLKIRNSKQYKFANIVLRINVSRSFLEILDDFIDYIASLFADDPRFSFLFVPVVKFSGSKFSDEYVCADHKGLFEQLLKNDVYMNKMYPDELRLSSIVPQKKCPAAVKNSYVITSDLGVYKCNAHYDFEANKLGSISLRGDLLLDEPLHKKWYLTKRFVKKIPEICNDCFYLPCCCNVDSGCPVTYLKTKEDEVPCLMKDKEQEKNVMEAILYAASKYPCTLLDL